MQALEAVGTGVVGIGLTVILNDCVKLTQPFAVACAEKLATTGVAPGLETAVARMLVVPEGAIPIDELEFVQEKVEPPTSEVKLIALVKDPLHNV